MEDTTVVPGHFCYSFRIDLSAAYVGIVKMFAARWDVAKYLGKFEKGAVTEHDHFQGVIWFEQKVSVNGMNKMRQWCKKFVKNRKGGGVSITSAQKISSLVKYCQKDESELFTNLTKDELFRCGKWKNKNDEKKQKLEKLTQLLYDYCETTYKIVYKNKNPWEIEIDYNKSQFYSDTIVNDFYINFLHIYFRVYGTPCVSRNQFYKWAWKLGIISTLDYLAKLNVVTQSF